MKQFLLPIVTLGSEELYVGIAHPFSSQIACWNNPTIQPTIVHSNQANGWGHSDWYYFPIMSLKNGTDVRSGESGYNIDNRTEVNPQGPVRTIIPDINILRSFPIRWLSDFTNWDLMSHDVGQSEEHVCNDIYKNAPELKKLSAKIVFYLLDL